MPRILVDSLDDPRLEPYRDLRHPAATPRGAWFIAEAQLVVERLVASDYACESVLVEVGRHTRFLETLPRSLDVLVVEPDMLRRLVGFDFHRGILACGHRRPLQSAAALPPAAPGDAPLLVACGVTDAENMGSLIRSAAGMGVERMVITPDSADPLSRRVLRVSMGTALRMAIYTASEPAADLAALAQRQGYRTVATALTADAVPLEAFASDQRPLAIIVGNEADGLPRAILRSATDCVTIPMHSGVDSLNVAVAGAIVLYTLTAAQRRLSREASAAGAAAVDGNRPDDCPR